MNESLGNVVGHIGFAVGCIGLSGFISYSLWIKIRVMRLRQDIYDYRNRLWDFAFEEGYLTEPAYLVARQHLNALVQCSKYVSLHLIRTTSKVYGDEARLRAELPACNERLRARIEEAFDWSAERISRYIFLETCAGWFCKRSKRPHFKQAMRNMRAIPISAFAKDEVLPFILSDIPATIIDLQATLARLARLPKRVPSDFSRTA